MWLELACRPNSLLTPNLAESFPGGSLSKESTCNAGDCLQCRRLGFDPWVGKIPWRRKWLPTPAFLPGKSHGQRSLESYSSWGPRVALNLVTKPPPIYHIAFKIPPSCYLFIHFDCWVIFHCVNVPQCIYPFNHQKTPGWFPVFGDYE